MRAQVLKRDLKTQRVTLAVATIPAMESSVFGGPKGIVSFSEMLFLS